MTVIDVAKDFARYPFGRYRTDGPYSGQKFREEFLAPVLQQRDQIVEVLLDGAIGMGSSFLEEAFGGLVREGFDRADIQRRVHVISHQDETLVTEIAGYIAAAEIPLRHAFA